MDGTRTVGLQEEVGGWGIPGLVGIPARVCNTRRSAAAEPQYSSLSEHHKGYYLLAAIEIAATPLLRSPVRLEPNRQVGSPVL